MQGCTPDPPSSDIGLVDLPAFGDNRLVTANRDHRATRKGVGETDGNEAGRPVRVATAAAIGLGLVLPAIELARTAILPGYGNALPALLATACALPLQLRHVIYGIRGERPPAAAWTLSALALVNLVAAIVVGIGWLLNFALLAVSVLIIVRGPLALLLVAALVIVAGALAGTSELLPGPYVAFSVVWRTVTLFVPVWLVATIWQLEGARLELRDRALVRERLRIQADLHRGLGGALDDVVASASRAAVAVKDDPRAAIADLQVLVGGSRQALADARRLIAGYRAASMQAELDSAVTLLEAAGVESRLVVQEGFSLETVDERSRAVVRMAVTRALRDESLSRCVIEVGRGEGEGLLVRVSADDGTARLWAGES